MQSHQSAWVHQIGKLAECHLVSNMFGKLQHEEAMRRAERRIADLLRKADAVDKVEHERVTAALTAAQEQLAGAQAEVDRLTPLQASVSQLKQEAEDMQARLVSVQVLTASVCCKCFCTVGKPACTGTKSCAGSKACQDCVCDQPAWSCWLAMRNPARSLFLSSCMS